MSAVPQATMPLLANRRQSAAGSIRVHHDLSALEEIREQYLPLEPPIRLQ